MGEPSGEECTVLDSALKWKWNSVRCVISASVVCVGGPKGCLAPDARYVLKLVNLIMDPNQILMRN